MTKDYYKPIVYSEFIDSSFTLRSRHKSSIVYRIIQRSLGIAYSLLHRSPLFATQYIAAQRKELERFNTSFLNAFEVERKKGGLQGKFQYIKYAELVRLIREIQPNKILEFGSGNTSILFSLLIGKEYHLALEESKYWATRTMDSNICNVNVNIEVRPRVVHLLNDEVCTKYDFNYSSLPCDFDVVYIDGPSTNIDENDLISSLGANKLKDPTGLASNSDVLEIISLGKLPRYIIVDTRRSTVRSLCKQLSGSYDILLKTAFDDSLFARCRPFMHHTVFRLKK